MRERNDVIALRASEFKPGRPYPRGRASTLFLHLFDELYKLGHGIQAQQGQEPTVKGVQLRRWSTLCQVEEAHRFFRKCVHESRDPAGRACSDTLDNHIVHANEYRQ